MWINIVRAAALVLAFVNLESAARAEEPVRAKLRAYMEAHARLSDFSGAVLVIGGGKVLLRGAYGPADREAGIPNAADTRFRIASLSKPFTAVAVLQLVERGKLSLDDRLDKFLGGFPGGDKISVHMMLTHTSGLANNHDWDVAADMAMSTEKAVEIVRKKPLEFEPGSRDGYSNTAYFLLSLIIEKASGESYAEYMRKNVFEPAGLRDTAVYDPRPLMPKRARHYRHTRPGLNAPVENEGWWNYAMFQGHGNLVSTVDDLYRFTQALDQGRLLADSTRAKMFSNHLKRFGYAAGYGVGLAPQFKRKSYYHSGRFNGATSIFTAFPDDRAFVAILSNAEAQTLDLYKGLAGIMFGEAVELPSRPAAVRVDPELFKDYAGRYGRTEIVVEGGRLMLAGPAGGELRASSPTKFFLADDPNRTFEFERGAAAGPPALVSTSYGVRTVTPRSE